MQILESTMIGLRSARITLSSSNSPVEVTLFPMVHIGERAFYEAVYEDALSHDVVLVEGVGGPIAKRIARAYTWIVGSPKLGLVLQSSVRPLSRGRARVVHADLSPEEFWSEWRRVPLWLRLFVYLAAPWVGLGYRLRGSRQALADGMSLDDSRSPEEFLFSPEIAALEGAIVDARDRRLIEHLERLIRDPTGGESRIAVLYGAGHMRAVLRHLVQRLGYLPSRTEWRTVFAL